MQRILRREISRYLEVVTTLWADNVAPEIDDGYLSVIDASRIALGGDLIMPRLI